MKIRLLERIRRPEVQGSRGDVVEVSDPLGAELDRHGYATIISEPTPEVAETPEASEETQTEEAAAEKPRRAKKATK